MRISDWSSDVCSSDLTDVGDNLVDHARDFDARLRRAIEQRVKLGGKIGDARIETTHVHHAAFFACWLARRIFSSSDLISTLLVFSRSEERRVGKEWVRRCRSRW